MSNKYIYIKKYLKYNPKKKIKKPRNWSEN